MTTFDPEKITFFAKTDARGQEIPFGIKAKDRQRHMYVIGKTGMGKSTLLENMAAQDIMNGEGMAFIDPHGSAAETLLNYVPEHRINDVVYFAPFDLDHPVSFNVMEDVGPDKRHLVVSGLMSTFKKIWVDAWSARMEYILTNTLLALIEYPDTTLLSVNRMLSDKYFRDKVVDYVKDPAVKAYWTEEFANYTERFAAEALPAIQNKIGQFTGNPLIRNIIGQPHSSFDIRTLMDEKKILIMNLSKGLIGETNANLLGSMLTTRIYLAAMSRADLPVEQMKQMPNFYFYVDEFQSFANSTFANILSEARKYHLNLIIAHQYVAQMEDEVRDAVFGNVGTTISFRVGPFDGEVLETVFAPRFTATDLVNLGFAQIYLTLMIDGIGSQPFSAVTLPPVEVPPVSTRELTIAHSRKNYASDRASVEEIITKLHTVEKPPEQEKGNGNGKGGNNGNNGNGKNNHANGKGKSTYAGNNGNGKPNNNGNGSHTPTPIQKPNSNHNGKPAAPTTRSPEELRSILAQVAGKEDGNKQSNSGSKEHYGQSVSRTPKTDSKAKDDLKAALAGVLRIEDTSPYGGTAQMQSSTEQSHTTEKKTARPTNHNQSDYTVAAAKRVQPNPVQTGSLPKASVGLQQTLDTILGTTNAKSDIEETVMATEPVATSESKAETNDPLDPKKIKKMLRHATNERSPFHDAG